MNPSPLFCRGFKANPAQGHPSGDAEHSEACDESFKSFGVRMREKGVSVIHERFYSIDFGIIGTREDGKIPRTAGCLIGQGAMQGFRLLSRLKEDSS